MSFEELDTVELGQADLDDQASKIETYYKQDMADKLLRAYVWDESIRFFYGDQHIEYNVATSRFQSVTVTRNNDFIPRSITNFIFPVVRTVVSQLTKNRPQANVRPNSSDPRDVAAAKVADLSLDAKWEELREEEKQQEKAYWGVITGTSFKKIYWDETAGKVMRIPKYKDTPSIDQTTNQPVIDETTNKPVINKEPELDATGQQVVDDIPVGDVNTSIIPPFNIALPLNCRSPLDMDWIMEYSIQKLEWIKEQYSKNGDGYTGKAEEVQEEKDLSTILQLEYRLRTLVGRKTGGHYSTGSSGYIDIKNAAVLKEFYGKPNRKFPKGRMIIVANGKTLYSGDSPYYIEGFEDSWNPYVEWRFELVPGRAWGKGLVDELVPIQRRINAIDSLIILNRKTMAVPQWLLPDGCGVPNGYINGRPGLNIPYRPVGANGAKPEKVEPSQLPQSVFQEKNDGVEALKRLGMTNEVLEGINPSGVKTAYQLEQLQENAIAAYGATFQRWEKSFEREETKKLLLIANRYKEARPEFNKKLKKINKDITSIDIDMFIGSDLRDNVEVRVEVGSSIPRSRAGENALLREMVQGQIVDVVNDPVNKKELLTRMGIKGFDYKTSPDIKRAEWENSIIEFGNPQDLIVDETGTSVLELDDDMLHIFIHSGRMKDPNVMPEVRKRYQLHIEEHLQHQAAGMNAAAQTQMPGNTQEQQVGDMNNKKLMEQQTQGGI